MERGAEFLLSCQFPSGAMNDRLRDPLSALAGRRPSRRLLFRLKGGADIWHTANAIVALRKSGRTNAAAERFVRNKVSAAGELSYWSAYPSLCIETCAAACLALPDQRPRLAETIARHALPGGRWSTSMVPAPGGYDAYLAGPSVTAWALSALGREHPRLARAARTYLEATRAEDGLWQAHPAFYATPFYPAHLAVRFMPSPSAREAIAVATLLRQMEDGGWGFSAAGKPSALPTALASLTLLHSGVRTTAVMRALGRAASWLQRKQSRRGSFSLAPAPAVVFYAGDVYATCLSMMALAGAIEVF